MARKTTTSGQRSSTKTATTRRVQSLEPKKGKSLSSLEEAVVRMHHGVSVKPSAKLPTNGVNDDVMAQMFEIEVKAHVETGRIDDLPDLPKKAAPKNAKTAKVVEKLKKKR
jgi:hypothetical protein